MNLKASFFNYSFLKENIKKSKGAIFLFIFAIPIFTYLFMLLQDSESSSGVLFPSLADLSIPSIIGMYIVPFVIAVSLFSFLFKKDSVDFINALPINRKTIYVTNIIGGIGIFFVIFLFTTLIMFLGSFFFDALVIPKAMYFHYFITFFITYIFTFIVSCLTISLTGSRMVHVALTLIVIFIPGFISDFYNSRVYNNYFNDNYAFPTCDKYDRSCDTYEINNKFIVEQSFNMESGATLPYKYVSIVPRAIFGMDNNAVMYNNELSSVYNFSSIMRMIILSIFYFAIGMFAFINRKMEIAETTFKSENIHQLVKCLTLFPLCLGAITLFNQSKELLTIWIMLAIIGTIYIVYDLITRRNNRKIVKSIIYFLGLILATIIIYVGLDFLSNSEATRVVKENDIANIGIAPNIQLGADEINRDLSVLKYKVTDASVINLIFDNANKKISNVSEESKQFTIRLQLKNGSSYYFNMRLTSTVYDKLLDLLDKNVGYTKALKQIPYDKVYGVKLGQKYLDKETGAKIVDLIKEGYKDKSVKDIINANYMDYTNGNALKYSLLSTLFVYDASIKTYSINTMINPDLINYVMQTRNAEYIKNIKDKNVNVNQLSISIDLDYTLPDSSYYSEYIYNNQEVIYRYVNDNIKSNIDFSKYTEDDLVCVSVLMKFGYGDTYQMFLPKDAAYDKLLDDALKAKITNPIESKDKI